MAWRSSGSTNDELVDNLKGFRVITSSAVEKGFRSVDRRYFVPPGREDMAHTDQPLKEGNIHISAPHIYGSAIEALELRPGAPLSFLNVGSGTGYVSCIVASILGHLSVNLGVEVHQDVVEHSRIAMARWKAAYTGDVPHMQVIHGNGLNIVPDKGEAAIGFDRIYIGAAVARKDLQKITCMLKPGGILVGPAEDELVKIVRVRNLSNKALASNGNDFSEQVLSGVRFAPLLSHPQIETLLPSNVWDPSVHQTYPDSFRSASKTLILCSNANYIQPPPEMLPANRLNLAALLPPVIWMEILSFTHRDWFEPKQSDEASLRQRLSDEQENAKNARRAAEEAKAMLHIAERERDVYKLLARRWQTRLQLLAQQQRIEQMQDSDEDLSMSGCEDAAIFGMGAMLRNFQSESGENWDDSEQDMAGEVPDDNLALAGNHGEDSDSECNFSSDDEVARPLREPGPNNPSNLTTKQSGRSPAIQAMPISREFL